VEDLRALGAEIQSIAERGYLLRMGFKDRPGGGGALDASRILAALPADARERVHELDVVWSTTSTNSTLLERAQLPTPGLAVVQLAEHQSAGRGRRGRSWVAPLGGALCLSIGWTYEPLPPDIAALSLAVGVGVRRVLEAREPLGIGLKWPNDLVAHDAKLGGILIERRALPDGPGYVVVGLGLNIALPAALRAELAARGISAIHLESLGAALTDRNQLAAALIAGLIATLHRFGEQGFAAFAADWAAADHLQGREVRVESAGAPQHGIARGVDASGALLLETARGTLRILSAEVSVRPAAEPA
jgi:BirA family biotin operon repressor/biotin-[acetyl-CoA-carboxylase] ligase